MMPHESLMHGAQFVDMVAQHPETLDQTYLPRRYEVSSVSGGQLVLREVVTGEIIEETYAGVLGPNYTVGMEVMAIPVSAQELFVLGPIMRSTPALLDFAAPFVGRVYVGQNRSTNATNNSNTSTTNWLPALTCTTTLPDGTYDVVAEGSCLMAHDTSGTANLRLTIAGSSEGGVTSQALTTTFQARVGTTHVVSGVVVSGGSFATTLDYKANTAGGALGAQARNIQMVVIATRTA